MLGSLGFAVFSNKSLFIFVVVTTVKGLFYDIL